MKKVWIAPVSFASSIEEGVSPDTVFVLPVGGLDFPTIMGNAIKAVPCLQGFELTAGAWVLEDSALAKLPSRAIISDDRWIDIQQTAPMVTVSIEVTVSTACLRMASKDLVSQMVWLHS